MGHQRNVQILKKLIATGRVPHALLFCGPEGVGKSTVAQVFIAGLLCRDEGARPCGSCAVCQAVGRWQHPDVLVVEPDGQNIKIDQIRRLQEEAALSGHTGTRRFSVILAADRMNEQAANSLLKLLEEPPADMVLILVTARPDALLPTIRSRCSRLQFEPLAAMELTGELGRRGYGKTEAEAASRLSGGRLGLALAILAPSGLECRDKAFSLLELSMTADMPTLLAAAQECEAYSPDDLAAVLRYAVLIVRDVIVYQECGDFSLIYNADAEVRLARLANQAGSAAFFEAAGLMESACQSVRQRANVRLTIEALLLRLSAAVGS